MQQEKIDQLLQLGLEGVDSTRARNVLQNHNWNVESAVDSLLSAVIHINDPSTSPAIGYEQPSAGAKSPGSAGVTPLGPSTDRGNAATPSTLRPSTREDPEQNWALVPVSSADAKNHSDNQQQQEAADMEKAIQLSMSHSFSEASKYWDPPAAERKRPPNSPVALRLTRPPQRDALVLQALYAVPQFREAILSYLPASDQKPVSDDYWRGAHAYAVSAHDERSPRTHLQHLQRLFSFMALTSRRYLNVDDIVDLLNESKGADCRPSEAPRIALLDTITRAVANENDDGDNSISPRMFRSVLDGSDTVELDTIALHVTPQSNALFPCLFRSISPRAFRELAEVLVFAIDRSEAGPDHLKESKPQRFVYPGSMFLDQFMLSHETRTKERVEMHKSAELQAQLLKTKHMELVSFQGKDTLKSLQITLEYLNNHKRESDEACSREELKRRLQTVSERIERETLSLQGRIAEAENAMSGTFEVADAQHYEYALRAVVIEDGQYGRTHALAYLQSCQGGWYKVRDLEVTATTLEHAIQDTSGLHLGGGPKLLFYSRMRRNQGQQVASPAELVREPYRAHVYDDNKRFADELDQQDAPKHHSGRGLAANDDMSSTSPSCPRGGPVSEPEMGEPMNVDIPAGIVRIA